MKRTRHPWTPADNALMRAEYGRTPTRELAARIGVTPGAINQRAKKLHLDAGRAVWTPERIAQLRGLYATRAALMARNSLHRYPAHIVKAVQAVGTLNRQINRRVRAAQPEEPHQ